MQVLPQHLEQDSYCISENASDISDMCDSGHALVESRSVVVGLPSVAIAPIVASPVRVVTSVANVDREVRAKYMREWQANAKCRRMEARALALIAPHR